MGSTHQLVEQYVPLAKKLAFQKKKTLPKFVDVDDLLSAAYLGLVEAASRFDATLGVAFQTFAYPRIFGAIHDWLREQGWMRRGDLTPMGSLDATDDDQPLRNLIPGRAAPDTEECFEAITLSLGERDRLLLREYFINDKPMREIGRNIGVSESRVSQMLSRCKEDIRLFWDERELRTELAA